MFAVSGTLCGVGVALIVVGLRGRRTDDHPLCRRCRFDLTGRPPDAVRRCPECGADLNQRRAVVMGHRRRRFGLLTAGLGLVATTLAWSGVWAFGRYRHVDWLRHAPLAYLTYMASSPNPDRRAAPLVELQRREVDALGGGGDLAPADLERVLDDGLSYQADTAKPLDPAWGTLIETAWQYGKLSADRWHRYLDHAWPGTVGIAVRRQVRQGDPAPFAFVFRPGRVASVSTVYVHVERAVLRLDGGGPYDASPIGAKWCCATTPAVEDADAPIPADCLAGLTPGPHRVTVTLDLSVKTHTESGVSYTDAKPVLRMRAEATASFQLLPATEPSVAVLPNTAAAEGVRRSLRCVVEHFPDRTVDVYIEVTQPPVHLGYDVYLRCRGRDTRVDQRVFCRAGGFNYWRSDSFDPNLIAGGPVTVVLRPNPSAARRQVDVFDVWADELVFPDVPSVTAKVSGPDAQAFESRGRHPQ